MKARQGDVLILSVEAIPDGLRRSEQDGPTIRLAEGEATGHNHSIATEDVVDCFADDATGAIFLRTIRQSVVTHPEHGPITLPPGTYRITRQREYSPEAIRNVAD